jgi:streptomycin 6-kinase
VVPIEFAERMAVIHGARGRAWVAGLPALLLDLQARWGIDLGPPFPALAYNYVAPSRDGRSVLKVGPPAWEADREPIALRAYDGRGAARLERHDATSNAVLLERVRPGTDLRDVPDPEAAEIAAGVLGELWRSAVPEGLAELPEWTRSLVAFERDPGPLPKDLVDRAAAVRRELLTDPPERVVVHGDLHHTNVLWSDARGWLAIDPKGLVGEKAFDVPFFLLNPGPVPPEATRLRIDTFVERLGLERERVVAWAFVQAVLSACWTVEDHGTDWSGAIRFAEEARRL